MIKKMWRWIRGDVKSRISEPENVMGTAISEPEVEKKSETSSSEPTENGTKNDKSFGYGLEMLDLYLRGNDWGWSSPDPNHKKVILVNADDCKGNITLLGIISAWRGTGHSEWEAILGAWFIYAIIKAEENNSSEADITHLFNHDLLTGSGDGRIFTQKQIFDHLIRFFDIIEDADDEMKVKVRIE